MHGLKPLRLTLTLKKYKKLPTCTGCVIAVSYVVNIIKEKGVARKKILNSQSMLYMEDYLRWNEQHAISYVILN